MKVHQGTSCWFWHEGRSPIKVTVRSSSKIDKFYPVIADETGKNILATEDELYETKEEIPDEHGD